MEEKIILEGLEIPIPSYMRMRGPLFLRHLKTYLYILDYVRNKNVLDIGCSYGYGTFFLSKNANKVVGIDFDEERIEKAQSYYKSPNLEFISLDAFKLTERFSESSFEVIIALEFIEHIKNPERFLEIAHYLLSKDGIFILSTPNRLFRSVEGKPWNPEHIQEFDKDSLEDLLKTKFQETKVIGMTGSEKAVLYDKIRTGGKTPSSIKRMWRYIPEWMKFPIRKMIGSKLPKDITLNDYFFDDEVTDKCFSLMGICKK